METMPGTRGPQTHGHLTNMQCLNHQFWSQELSCRLWVTYWVTSRRHLPPLAGWQTLRHTLPSLGEIKLWGDPSLMPGSILSHWKVEDKTKKVWRMQETCLLLLLFWHCGNFQEHLAAKQLCPSVPINRSVCSPSWPWTPNPPDSVSQVWDYRCPPPHQPSPCCFCSWDRTHERRC